MRLPALIMVCLPALLPAAAAAQATLNKCIDADGRVTYSNLPCRGAREVKKVEIDPPPPLRAPAPSAPATPAVQPEQPAAQPVPAASEAPPAVPAQPPVPPVPAETPRPTAAPLPAPAPSPAQPAPIATPLPAPTPLPVPTPSRAAPPSPTAAPRAESPSPAKRIAPRTCDALTDQLGRVLDQMDAAQRGGVSQQHMDAWGQEIRNLERRKTEAGCF